MNCFYGVDQKRLELVLKCLDMCICGMKLEMAIDAMSVKKACFGGLLYGATKKRVKQVKAIRKGLLNVFLEVSQGYIPTQQGVDLISDCIEWGLIIVGGDDFTEPCLEALLEIYPHTTNYRQEVMEAWVQQLQTLKNVDMQEGEEGESQDDDIPF